MNSLAAAQAILEAMNRILVIKRRENEIYSIDETPESIAAVCKKNKTGYEALVLGFQWNVVRNNDDLLESLKHFPYTILASFNEDGLIHSLDHPALTVPYFKLQKWFAFGVEINKEIARGDIQAIIDADNSESRAVGIRIVGYEAVAKKAGWKTFDISPGKINVKAMRALVGTKTEKYFVCTDGSSSRTFCIPVPNETKSADQAAEWVNGYPDKLLMYES